jgi:pyruvate/2-oxoglutarate dehydrogenase complex dihydrolipoamide acyltransferase (E2) component
MNSRYLTLCTGAVLAAIALQGAPANAMSMTDCSAKYKAAKADGSLNGMKWNDFRKAQCGADAAAAPAAAPAPATASAPPPAAAPAPAPKPAAAPIAVGNAVFPSAVDSKYSKDSAGKGRMLTCLDQYRANKTGNGNGGLKWIQKGGGYYSECNKHLKG